MYIDKLDDVLDNENRMQMAASMPHREMIRAAMHCAVKRHTYGHCLSHRTAMNRL